MAKKPKDDEVRSPGTTTIAPNVLVTIAQLTALQVEGVAGLAPQPVVVKKLFRRGIGDGVDLDIQDGAVTADLYLVLKAETNVRDVSRNVQQEVARALEEMVGMPAGAINVHIQDIDYQDAAG